LNGEFRIGAWLVQPRLNAVIMDGLSVRLEPKVMQVLVCLARGAGDVVEKEQLIRTVWPDTFVSDDALTRCISELRKTFEDDARESRIIQTIPKIGYRLVAPIEEVARPAVAPPVPAVEAHREAAAPVAVPAPKLRSLAPWIAAGTAILALLAVAYWHDRHTATAPKVAIDSIAVLPFTNGTPDPAIDYLSDGIAMSVSNGLSKIPNVKVISQTSTSYYRGQRINPTLVGEQLGAQALVTGRMVKKGDDLVIDVELVRARENSHLWGAEYEHPANEVLAMEEEIARDIIANLQIRPSQGPAPPAMRRPTNNEAYQLYLQGRYFWNRRTPEGINKSIDYFQQAIDKDPQDALAYAGLADAYNLLSDYNSVPPREAFPKAQAAALKALSLDDSLAEAHASLAMVKCSYDWDLAGAEKEFRRAIALDPNYATARQWYSLLLEGLDRQDEARNEAQKALELDPLSLIINSNLANIDCRQKRFDAAEKIITKVLDLDPHSYIAYGISMSLHLEQGNCPAALADFEIVQKIAPGAANALAEVGEVYARCGEKEKALAVAHKLEALSRKQYVAPIPIALIYAWLGDKDRTLVWLERALAVRDDIIMHPYHSPALAFLHNDPRFQKFLQEIKPLN
jgi:DNA-binding winged helix-turn-helix (wHTH) protein/TolB-like protein/Tfp pilus assembly protein PilF